VVQAFFRRRGLLVEDHPGVKHRADQGGGQEPETAVAEAGRSPDADRRQIRAGQTATIKKASSSAPIKIAVRPTRRQDPLNTMISRGSQPP
jgi:hypothetical protein